MINLWIMNYELWMVNLWNSCEPISQGKPIRKSFIYAQLIEIVDVAKPNFCLIELLSVG